jgi:hypothetical protein
VWSSGLEVEVVGHRLIELELWHGLGRLGEERLEVVLDDRV